MVCQLCIYKFNFNANDRGDPKFKDYLIKKLYVVFENAKVPFDETIFQWCAIIAFTKLVKYNS